MKIAGMTDSTVDNDRFSIVLFTAGCSLQCDFCQNKELWDSSKGVEMSAEDILKRISHYEDVVITGGEPTEQDDFINIIKALAKDGKKIVLYTNGLNAKKVMEALPFLRRVFIDVKPECYEEQFYNEPKVHYRMVMTDKACADVNKIIDKFKEIMIVKAR